MTGVILFRAQPFHNGHLAQIKRALEDIGDITSNLYIFVGSADKFGTKRNPIPIEMRLELIKESLREVLPPDALKHIEIIPLDDLNDEANNTHSWGNYLYSKMCGYTGDTEFLFYYSDKPEIALSWFNNTVRNHICFKFLNRVNDTNATYIRNLLMEDMDSHVIYHLNEEVPPYVFSKRHELHEYIINAR